MARIKYWDEESQTWKYADKSLGVNIDLTEYAKKEDIPTKLPNPNVLTFTGAVNATYDGSEAVEVEIPQGGGGGSTEWNTICEGKIAEAVSAIVIDSSADGTPLEALDVNELLIYGAVKLSANSKIRFERNGMWVSGTYATTAGQFGAWVAPFCIRQQKIKNGTVTEISIESEHKVLC